MGKGTFAGRLAPILGVPAISTGDIIGLEILNLVATNWFDEEGLSAAPLKQKKCIVYKARQSRYRDLKEGVLLFPVC